jgi:hypothetical protein
MLPDPLWALNNYVGACGLDSSGLGCGPVMGSCEHGNGPWDTINGQEIFIRWANISFSRMTLLHAVMMLIITIIIIIITDQFGLEVTLWICVREVLGSNLSRNTDCPNWGFWQFSLVPKGKCWDISIRLRLILFESFPTHHWWVIPSSDTI